MSLHKGPDAPRLTSIGSGKGGTGKTFIAVNLAVTLAAAGERVLLCDADFGLANTTVQLGLAQGGDLASVLAGTRRLGDAVTRVAAGPRASFDLISAPSGSGALANLGAPAGDQLVAKLRTASNYDRVLIDLGAGVDALVMTLAAQSDETLLVLINEPSSLTDAYAFAKLLLQRTAGRSPGLLVNRATSIAEAQRTAGALIASARAFLKKTIEHFDTVPNDSHASEATRRQMPLVHLYPQSPAALALARLAQRLRGPAALPQAQLAIR